MARPPTPQLSSRFDSRAMHARTLLPAALASVPFGFALVRVRFFSYETLCHSRAVEKTKFQLIWVFLRLVCAVFFNVSVAFSHWQVP